MSAKNRIIKEIAELALYTSRDDIDESNLLVNAELIDGSDLFHWKGEIIGAKSTPYADGKYLVNIKLPADYPFRPPKVRFVTPIYHPNVSENGDIHLNILQLNWSPALTITKVLLTISAILDKPAYIGTYSLSMKCKNELKEQFIKKKGLNIECIKLYINDRLSFENKANNTAVKYANASQQYHLKHTFLTIKSGLGIIFGYIASMIEPIIMEFIGFNIVKLNKFSKELKLDQDKRYKNLLDKQNLLNKQHLLKNPSLMVNCIWGDLQNEFKIWNNYTIKDIKELIFDRTGFTVNQTVLLFNGKVLENDKSIHEYNITNKCTIHRLLKYE